LTKVEKDEVTDRGLLRSSLDTSGAAIDELPRRALAPGGRTKGYKPHPMACLGYPISHERDHCGEIWIILTRAGFPLDQKSAYGQWEWGVR
jgi:hypothetical protein